MLDCQLEMAVSVINQSILLNFVLRKVGPRKVDLLRAYQTLFEYLYFYFQVTDHLLLFRIHRTLMYFFVYVQDSALGKGEKIWVIGGQCFHFPFIYVIITKRGNILCC